MILSITYGVSTIVAVNVTDSPVPICNFLSACGPTSVPETVPLADRYSNEAAFSIDRRKSNVSLSLRLTFSSQLSVTDVSVRVLIFPGTGLCPQPVIASSWVLFHSGS